MPDIRYRILLLQPLPAPSAGEPDRARAAVPPLSFWFMQREDAEVVAQLSAIGQTGVALLAYDGTAAPRLLRFLGSDDLRADFVAGPIARGEEASLAEADFFGSGPAPHAAPRRRAA